jgi:hypothetical protein
MSKATDYRPMWAERYLPRNTCALIKFWVHPGGLI